MWFLRRFRHFSSNSQNAPRAMTFDTLCRVCAALPLRFTKTASSPCHKKCCACQDIAQSAVPAKRKRRAGIDTLLKYCACHAKRKRNLNACHKTQQKHAICEKIDLQHVIQITLCERCPMVRISDLVRAPCEDVRTCWERLRSLEQRWANTPPTFRPLQLNERTLHYVHSNARSNRMQNAMRLRTAKSLKGPLQYLTLLYYSTSLRYSASTLGLGASTCSTALLFATLLARLLYLL